MTGMGRGARARDWLVENRAMLLNSGALVGTQGLNAAFGFAFWWLAARRFMPAAVGLASAAVSAMLLLGLFGALGLGTLLIGELPRRTAPRGTLIATALLVSAAGGGLLGLVFALVASRVAVDLAPLGSGGVPMIFALGVALTACTQVLDSALIGLLRGGLQFWRNAIFAATKLAALLGAVLLTRAGGGVVIYATWVVGNAVSLLAVATILAPGAARPATIRPDWRLLRGLGCTTLGHHALNLALQAPGLALPVVTTIILSASLNAAFYIAWMLTGFVLVGVLALTTVLYAMAAADPSALARRLRLTLRLAVAGGLAGNAILLALGGPVLRLFGDSYAADVGTSLHILALGVFPIVVKDHYVAIRRVRGEVGAAAGRLALGAALEVSAAAGGAAVGGLTGLSLAWVGALCIEAVAMGRAVRSAARLP